MVIIKRSFAWQISEKEYIQKNRKLTIRKGYVMKILIAEDDSAMQKILRLYLEKEGYQVAVADNGEESLSYLEENTVDLLILDWMMPVRNGIEVCKEIRMLGIPVKILMLTTRSENNHEIQGLSCGADDYLRKPTPPLCEACEENDCKYAIRLKISRKKRRNPINADLSRMFFTNLKISSYIIE